MDDVEATPSETDNRLGDEALAEAVLRELHEDAMTTDLQLQVEARDNIVFLRGHVQHLEDADAAEEVAGRVPGVDQVVDDLLVAGL